MQDYFLMEGKVLNAFKGSIFPFKTTNLHSDDLERTFSICINNRECIRYNLIQYIVQAIKTKIINFFNKSSKEKMDTRKRTQNITTKTIAAKDVHTNCTNTCW